MAASSIVGLDTMLQSGYDDYNAAAWSSLVPSKFTSTRNISLLGAAFQNHPRGESGRLLSEAYTVEGVPSRLSVSGARAIHDGVSLRPSAPDALVYTTKTSCIIIVSR